MNDKRSVRVVQLPARGQITLPVDFRQKLGLAEGDLLQMSLVGNKIEIEPVRSPEARLREYTDAEIQQFLEEDRINAETAATVRKLLASGAL